MSLNGRSILSLGRLLRIRYHLPYKVSYKGYAYQFKMQKPIYYPDRKDEDQRKQENSKKDLMVNLKMESKLPNDYYYQLLGVPHSATTDQIKTAYFNLAKRYHPDSFVRSEKMSKRFQDLVVAFNVLSDNTKRSEYDELRTSDDKARTDSSVVSLTKYPLAIKQNEKNHSVSKVGKLLSPLSLMYDKSTSDRKSEEIQRATTFNQKLELSFKEAAQGVKKQIQIKYLKKCPNCNGKSNRLSSLTTPEPCRHCNCSGQVLKRTSTYTSLVVCDRCNGKRHIYRNQCDACDNRGFVTITNSTIVTIPAGTKTGDTISVEYPETKQCVNYRVYVNESDYYRRVGNDIYTDYFLSISQAVLGGTVKIRSIERDIEVKLEPGVQSHTQKTLKGKGIKTREGGTGDHIVTFKIQIPQQLSAKQRSLIEALAKTEMNNNFLD